MSKELDLTTSQQNPPANYDPSVAYGFEESKAEDIVIPRIKVIQAMSPERQDGEANEGDIINGLTKENVTGKVFIPVKQYYSNIEWNPDRDSEPRMFCRSFDGRLGEDEDGTKSCAQCRRNQFDNTKTGREAQPKCTAYLNFFGFFEGDPMPVVLSFARTNYNEGRKLLSIARSMRCPAWNYGYTLEAKKVSKNKNSWYIMVPKMAGPTQPETRALAFEIFKAYQQVTVTADYEDAGSSPAAQEIDKEIAEEI